MRLRRIDRQTLGAQRRSVGRVPVQRGTHKHEYIIVIVVQKRFFDRASLRYLKDFTILRGGEGLKRSVKRDLQS